MTPCLIILVSIINFSSGSYSRPTFHIDDNGQPQSVYQQNGGSYPGSGNAYSNWQSPINRQTSYGYYGNGRYQSSYGNQPSSYNSNQYAQQQNMGFQGYPQNQGSQNLGYSSQTHTTGQLFPNFAGAQGGYRCSQVQKGYDQDGNIRIEQVCAFGNQGQAGNFGPSQTQPQSYNPAAQNNGYGYGLRNSGGYANSYSHGNAYTGSQNQGQNYGNFQPGPNGYQPGQSQTQFVSSQANFDPNGKFFGPPNPSQFGSNQFSPSPISQSQTNFNQQPIPTTSQQPLINVGQLPNVGQPHPRIDPRMTTPFIPLPPIAMAHLSWTTTTAPQLLSSTPSWDLSGTTTTIGQFTLRPDTGIDKHGIGPHNGFPNASPEKSSETNSTDYAEGYEDLPDLPSNATFQDLTNLLASKIRKGMMKL